MVGRVLCGRYSLGTRSGDSGRNSIASAAISPWINSPTYWSCTAIPQSHRRAYVTDRSVGVRSVLRHTYCRVPFKPLSEANLSMFHIVGRNKLSYMSKISFQSNNSVFWTQRRASLDSLHSDVSVTWVSWASCFARAHFFFSSSQFRRRRFTTASLDCSFFRIA